MCTLAPFNNRYRTMRKSPKAHAKCKAVRPSAFCAEKSAPYKSLRCPNIIYTVYLQWSVSGRIPIY